MAGRAYVGATEIGKVYQDVSIDIGIQRAEKLYSTSGTSGPVQLLQSAQPYRNMTIWSHPSPSVRLIWEKSTTPEDIGEYPCFRGIDSGTVFLILDSATHHPRAPLVERQGSVCLLRMPIGLSAAMSQVGASIDGRSDDPDARRELIADSCVRCAKASPWKNREGLYRFANKIR